MEIRETRKGEARVVSPIGRIDTRTSHEFEKYIVGLLDGGGKMFVIDFASVDYISSAGLRVLLMLAKKLAGGEGKLVLCRLNASVREVFDIAGFTAVFTISGTEEEALAVIRSAGEQKLSEVAAKLLGITPPRTKATSAGNQAQPEGAVVISDLAAKLLGIADDREGVVPPPAGSPPPPPAETRLQDEAKKRSSVAWNRLSRWFSKE